MHACKGLICCVGLGSTDVCSCVGSCSPLSTSMTRSAVKASKECSPKSNVSSTSVASEEGCGIAERQGDTGTLSHTWSVSLDSIGRERTEGIVLFRSWLAHVPGKDSGVDGHTAWTETSTWAGSVCGKYLIWKSSHVRRRFFLESRDTIAGSNSGRETSLRLPSMSETIDDHAGLGNNRLGSPNFSYKGTSGKHTLFKVNLSSSRRHCPWGPCAPQSGVTMTMRHLSRATFVRHRAMRVNGGLHHRPFELLCASDFQLYFHAEFP